MPALTTGSATYNASGDVGAIDAGATWSSNTGDVIWILVAHEGAAYGTPATAITLSDNNVGADVVYSLKQYVSHGNGDMHAALYRGVQTENIAAYLPTATFAGGTRPFQKILTLSSRPGGGETQQFDGYTVASGSSNAPNSGALSVSPNGAGFAVAFMANYTGGTHTAGSGWTAGSNPGGAFSEYRVLTNETSITGDSAWASNDAWIMFVAADETPSGGNATGTPTGGSSSGGVGTVIVLARPPPPYTLTTITG